MMNNWIKLGLFTGTLFLAVSVSAGDQSAEEPESETAAAVANNEPSNGGNADALQAGDQPNRPKSSRRSEEQIMQEECEGKSGKILADCQTQVHLDYQSGNYN